MRRDDICLYLSRLNARLEAIINDRNSKAKAIWGAKIVLATADGRGTKIKFADRTWIWTPPPFGSNAPLHGRGERLATPDTAPGVLGMVPGRPNFLARPPPAPGIVHARRLAAAS